MPEELKTPPAGTDDGAASTASATADAAVSDSAPAGETAEQRASRFEKERDDALALSKSYKGSAEEANQLREENRALKSRTQPAQTTDALPPAVADIVPDIQALDEQIARYGGDPNYSDHVAGLKATRKALTLQAQSAMREARNGVVWQETMDKVKDEGEQRLVYALVSSGRASTVEDAVAVVRGKKLPDIERENADLRKRLADQETAQRLRGVDLTTRGVPAEEHAQRGMKLGDWTKEWDAAKGRNDVKRMDELRKVARK